MIITPAKRNDVEEIVAILNEITVYLHSRKIMQWKYPWISTDIEKDMEDSFLYVLKDSEKIMGTFSLKPMADNEWVRDKAKEPNEEKEICMKENLYLYRIAIARTCQGNGIGRFLCDSILDYARREGKEIYLDCFAGNEKLKSFYRGAGFSYLGDYPEENYYISVFTNA